MVIEHFVGNSVKFCFITKLPYAVWQYAVHCKAAATISLVNIFSTCEPRRHQNYVRQHED